ncbi:hypothetical protein SAY87_025437 [Trapa incisa]|uniref:MBD domain-containing protein n=1 Tax=Trapa incisa TaxID=236973 RepID=A0AAN7JFS5_9MYRT|nr:hypothetical protein SAY87_025437 [Trapa incisa]
MSMSQHSPPAAISRPDSLNPSDTERFSGALPPDSLLKSGCVINPASNSNGGTRTNGAGKPNHGGAGAVASFPGHYFNHPVHVSHAPKSSSSVGASVAATPDSVANRSEDSRAARRRRRLSVGEVPDWLPAGWIVEDRVRASGATAGSIDKYYRDPVSGSLFRSKKEVLYFLENGIKRKKTTDSSDADPETGESTASQRQKNGTAPKSPPNFDFSDPPEKVTWVLNDYSNGSWTPYVDGKKVPDPTAKEWSATFNFISTSRP